MGIRIKPVTPKLVNEYYGHVPKNDETILGAWDGGRTIYLSDKADSYTILHEIGHVINGWMCCFEHCEYAAHGAALALAKTHNIKLPYGSKTKIDYYAGRSARKSCGAIYP